MTSVTIIAGGAGFIGSNLSKRLLEQRQHIVVVDNFSRGSRLWLRPVEDDELLHVVEADLSDAGQTAALFEFAARLGNITEIWHLAANSDIPAGVADPEVDLKDTFLTTFRLLVAMQKHRVGLLHFASSSAIYGDLGEQTLHENIGPLLPISNYGAMKLASEAQASAAAESFLDRVNIFRFPNVVGVPATHGVILDFIEKLKRNPLKLEVLGDGTQQKAYLHVSDLLEAMLAITRRPIGGKVEIVNIGPVDQGVPVRWIAEQVVQRINPKARIDFGVGNKGWIGDVPRFSYSTERLQSYGWSPSLGSREAILRAIDEIATQQGF